MHVAFILTLFVLLTLSPINLFVTCIQLPRRKHMIVSDTCTHLLTMSGYHMHPNFQFIFQILKKPYNYWT